MLLDDTRGRNFPWRSLVLAATTVLVAAVPGGAALFALDREAFAAGEWFRALTGHLVHSSRYHLWWNVLPLVGLGLLFEPALKHRLWGLVGVSAAIIGVGLMLLDPALHGYVGLSGVLNGVWVGGAMWAAREEARSGRGGSYWILIACVGADLSKIAVEAFSGLQMFTRHAALGGDPVPLAHALGALAGMIWLALPARVPLCSAPVAKLPGIQRILASR